VTGDVVQRSRDGRFWTTVAETTATQFALRELPRFSLHLFRVAAVNEAGARSLVVCRGNHAVVTSRRSGSRDESTGVRSSK
jgi:hypothetical protein